VGHVRAALGGRRAGGRQISGILGVLKVVEHSDRYQRGNGPAMTGENDAFVAVRGAVDQLAKLVAGFRHPDFSHLCRLPVPYGRESLGSVAEQDLRGHRVLHLVGKGNKPATMPLTVPVLRVLEAG